MWGGDFSLVILSTIIWAGGYFSFQPTLKNLFPYMITKVGIIGLIL